jgi:hypothetical protein
MKTDLIVLHPTATVDQHFWVLQVAIAAVLFVRFRESAFFPFFFPPFTLLVDLINWMEFNFTSFWVSLFYGRFVELSDFGHIEKSSPVNDNTILICSNDPDYHEKIKLIERSSPERSRLSSGSYMGNGEYYKCGGKKCNG